MSGSNGHGPRTFEVRILRQDAPGASSYWERHTLQHVPDMNVISVLQGIAGAALMPQVLSIIQVIFPPKERAKAFSFFGIAAGMASVAGPLVGGFLIDLNIAGLDWRPIFLIKLGLCISKRRLESFMMLRMKVMSLSKTIPLMGQN